MVSLSRGAASLALAAMAILLLLQVVTARSLFEGESKRSSPGTCGPRMACRWAFCNVSPKLGPYLDLDLDSCMVINNNNCACPVDHHCTRRNVEEHGPQHVMFEYRCMSPELTRDIYQLMGKRSVN